MSIEAASPARTRRQQIAILAAVAVVALGAHAWYGIRHGFFDLLVYRSAMRWWNGGNFLYDFAQPDATQGHLEFTYPPFAAFLLRPLGWLPPGVAIAAYTVVAVATLGLSIWWLVRPLADRHGWPRWFAVGLAFILATGLEPIREAYSLGQINFVLWALILLDLLVLAPRGSRLTGIGIGLATAIKLTPGIFIVYLLITRRWRAAATAAGTAVGVTLLAAAFAPRETWVYFTQKLLHAEGVGNLAYTFNQSLMGMLAKLALPGAPSQAVWLLLCLPVLGYGLWRARAAYLAGDEVAGLTLAGIVGSLVSPVTWAHHIFWFVPALVVLVDVAVSKKDRWAGALAIFLYATVTYSLVSLWDFTLHQPGGPGGFVLTNWLVLLMLGLLVLLPVRDSGRGVDVR